MLSFLFRKEAGIAAPGIYKADAAVIQLDDHAGCVLGDTIPFVGRNQFRPDRLWDEAKHGAAIGDECEATMGVTSMENNLGLLVWTARSLGGRT